MNFLFSTNTGSTLNHIWLFIFRIALSVFMLTHGWPKLMRLIGGGGADFSDPLEIGNNLSLVLAVIGEVVGPLLIIPGILTRLATIPVLSTMSVAAFIVHGDDPFKSMEMALLYLAGFLTILVFGPGRYSVDQLIGRK